MSAPLARLAVATRALGLPRPLGLLMAFLTAVTCAFLVGAPRPGAAADTLALREHLSAGPAATREITFRIKPNGTGQYPSPDADPSPDDADPFAESLKNATAALGPVVAPLVGEPVVSARTSPAEIARAENAAPPARAHVAVRVQSGLESRVRWISGGMPGAPESRRTLQTAQGLHHTVLIVPVAVSRATAEVGRLAVGTVLELAPPSTTTNSSAVVVSGIFDATDPADDYWTGDAGALQPGHFAPPGDPSSWVDLLTVVAAPVAHGALADSLFRSATTLDGSFSPALSYLWRLPLVTDRVGRGDVQALRQALDRAGGAPAWSAMAQRPALASGLGAALDAYARDLSAAHLLASMVTVGIAVSAALALAIAGALGSAVRAAEFALARARGASRGALTGFAALGASLWTLPAAALGAAVGVAMVPGATPPGSWAAAAATVLLPTAAIALRALRSTRKPLESVPGRTARAGHAVLMLVLAGAAALATSSMLTGGPARGDDWLPSTMPTLLALSVGRPVRTWPWRWPSRWASS